MLIEVRPGLRIEAKHIEAIEELDALRTVIYTSSRSFEIDMPMPILASMIEARSGQKDNSMGRVEKLLLEMYKGQNMAAY